MVVGPCPKEKSSTNERHGALSDRLFMPFDKPFRVASTSALRAIMRGKLQVVHNFVGLMLDGALNTHK